MELPQSSVNEPGKVLLIQSGSMGIRLFWIDSKEQHKHELGSISGRAGLEESVAELRLSEDFAYVFETPLADVDMEAVRRKVMVSGPEDHHEHR